MKKPVFHGFRIFRQEPLNDTFSRVILEQLGKSLILCGRFAEDPDFVTHEIRKSTKRIRAVYRLFGHAIGNDSYLHAKEAYSMLSKLIAEHRVSAAYIETLKRLASDQRLPVNAAFIEQQIAKQLHGHQQLTQKLINEQVIDHQVKKTIIKETEKLTSASVFTCRFVELREGLRNTYDQGRNYLDMAIQHAETENLHNLRKRVKSLWNQMILLRPVWPALISPTIHQFDMLAEKLGIEHDLAELEQHISKETLSIADGNSTAFLNFISKKRLQMQKTIIFTARRLFIEKPAEFSGKIEKYYLLFKGGR